jgi:hypothetical protein
MASVFLAGKVAEHRCLLGESSGWRRVRAAGERLAFHEAGHALCGSLLGLHIYSATITPDLGFSVGTGQHAAGMVTMGWKPQPEEAEPKRAGLPDNREAVRLCWILSGCKGWRETLRMVRLLQAETAELLEANWPAVVALAGELVRRRDLDQSGVQAILQLHLPMAA